MSEHAWRLARAHSGQDEDGGRWESRIERCIRCEAARHRRLTWSPAGEKGSDEIIYALGPRTCGAAHTLGDRDMEHVTFSWFDRNKFEADKAWFIAQGFRIEQEEEVKDSHGDLFYRAVAVKGSIEELAQEVRRIQEAGR